MGVKVGVANFSRVPRPLLRPQTAQNCGSYSFDARIKTLTEIYCYRQYLSVDIKKNLPRQL